MRWTTLDSGISWWLENAEGRTQAYVIKIEGKYTPHIMSPFMGKSPRVRFIADTLEEAQEHALVLLATKKLEGA
jgi:hypothetical protein